MANEYIERLHEARNKAIGEQRAIVDRAVAEGRETLDAEERATIERLDTVIDGHKAEIDSWLEREQRAKEADEARSQYESFVRPEKVAESFGEKRAVTDPFEQLCRGEVRSATIDLSAAAREVALVRGGASGEEFRDLMKSNTSSLVPTNYARTLYQYLETYSGVRRTGATVITTTDGNVLTMPKVSAYSAAAAAVAEGGPLQEADPTFTTFSLGAFRYGKLIQVSTQLPRDATVDIMSFVAQDAGRALGKATGEQYILGDGTTEPEGVTVGFQVGDTGAASVAGAPGYDDMIDLIYSLGDEAYRQNAVWLTKDANVKVLRKLKDQDQRPLWEPSLKAGEPDTFLGYRVVTDTYMPAVALSARSFAFGDFAAGFIIRDVASVRFERSDDYAFGNDLITFRAIIESDSAVRDQGAVKLFQGNAA